MLDSSALRDAYRRVPRISLATLPTPLHELPRLREALGGPTRAPRILIKRDDLTGLALGGNKARKLEFLIADALEQGARAVITTGATQSNHARMTAAAARMAGLECHLVLTSKSDDPPLQGNLLLDIVYGATVYHVPAPEDPKLALGSDEVKVREVEAKLRAEGTSPYVIAVGGSSPVGTLGYTLATAELLEQLAAARMQPSRLYYASGSRGTQAGLTLGAKACGAPYRLHPVSVSTGEPEKLHRAVNAANGAAELLGIPTRVTLDDVAGDNNFIGEGYGIPTAEGLAAIALLARTEGILVDPCYTSKAMAALIAHVRRGELRPEDTAVFLHTGGAPGMFTAEFAQTFRSAAAGRA